MHAYLQKKKKKNARRGGLRFTTKSNPNLSLTIDTSPIVHTPVCIITHPPHIYDSMIDSVNTATTHNKPVTCSSSTRQPSKRLTKRVYVLGAIVLVLVVYAILSEGMGGLVTTAVGFVALNFLWWVARVLLLDRVPFFRTLCGVLFKWTTHDTTPPPRPKRTVFQ